LPEVVGFKTGDLRLFNYEWKKYKDPEAIHHENYREVLFSD
jgi:hypothetical protein